MNKPFMWAYENQELHPADKFYFDSGVLVCTHCECAATDHLPQPEYYTISLNLQVASFSHANAALHASSYIGRRGGASILVDDNKTKFVISHWEDCGSAESGPQEPEQIGDAEFETEAEALAWVAEQTNPHWYAIEEVPDWN